MLHRVVLALGFGLPAAAAAAATDDEPVTIKLYAPKAGDRVRVTMAQDTVTDVAFELMGKKESRTDRTGQLVVYVQDVLAGGESGKKPDKARRTYERFSTTVGTQSTKHPLEGKTVLIEKKGDKYEFTYDGGGPVDGAAAEDLGREFNRPDDALERALLPTTPVRPGDTWKIELPKPDDPNALPFDPAKLTATGKLVKVYAKDGAKFGVVEVRMSAPVTSLGAKSDLKLKEGSFAMTGAIDGCLDGSSPAGMSDVKFEFKVKAESKDVPFEATTTTTKKASTELLPKK